MKGDGERLGISEYVSLYTELKHSSNTYDHTYRMNTGSRLLSARQACKGQISSWVGDDQRTPAVVCCFVFAKNFFFGLRKVEG
jgi:hypothetical protein